MFISFSQFSKKFGGLRFGLGVRVTKNNMIWMSLIALFVLMFKLCWYMMVLCFWLIYAVIYGIIFVCKKALNILKLTAE